MTPTEGYFDETLFNYAIRLLTLPYIYGGDDPMGGLDCSGYVVELMQSCGQIPHKSDFTAQGLADYFDGPKATHLGQTPRFGALCFYGKDRKNISHVAFSLDIFRVADYSGGDSTTTTLEEAKRRNAFGKIRPYNYRSDFLFALRPHYRTIGAL